MRINIADIAALLAFTLTGLIALCYVILKFYLAEKKQPIFLPKIRVEMKALLFIIIWLSSFIFIIFVMEKIFLLHPKD